MSTIGAPARRPRGAASAQQLAFGVGAPIGDREIDVPQLWSGFDRVLPPLDGAGGKLWRLGRRPSAEPAPAETRDAGSARSSGRGFVGLRGLIELVHDTAPVTYASGRVEIAVPFSHVMILAEQDTFGLEEVARGLEREMIDAFGRHIDPRLGARVRFYRSAPARPGAAEERLVCFVGKGIFVPQAAGRRHRVGRLELRRPGDDAVSEPLLPDGNEAAFHPGQSGLAFSGSLRLTPAVAGVLRHDATHYGTAFFLGRRRETGGMTFHAFDARAAAPAGARTATYGVMDPRRPDSELRDSDHLEPGIWYEVRRFVAAEDGGAPDREHAFDFRFRPDDGAAGGLAETRPPGPCLDVVALKLPDPRRSGGIARLWVDFTEAGRIVSTWLDERSFALTIGANGAVGLFDRREGEFVRGGGVLGSRLELTIGGHRWAIEELEGGRMLALRGLGAVNGLGHLALAAPPGVASALTTAASAHADDLALVWLGAVGLVELTGEIEAEQTAPASRFVDLAAWHDAAGSEAMLTLRPDGRLNVGDGRNARPLERHAEVELGPLIVRYSPG